MPKDYFVLLFVCAALADPSAASAQNGASTATKDFAEGFNLLRAGKPAEAEAIFNDGLKLDPNNALAQFYLGEALRAENKPDAARAAYGRSLQLDPNSAIAAAARTHLQALAATPTSSGPSAPSRAVSASTDPATITLPSGITVADWELSAVEKLKAERPQEVITSARPLMGSYGAIPSFSRIVAKAVDDRLGALPIDNPTSARRSLPELEDLAAMAPGSGAAARAKAARGVVIMSDAESKHAGGDYDGALAGYREALAYFPLGDPNRAKLVDDIAAATSRTMLALRDCPDICPEMVSIPAGSFLMGSPPSEPNREAYEDPQHEVTIAAGLFVSKYPVTLGEFSRFVAETNHATGDKCLTWEGGSWSERDGRSFRSPGFQQSNNEPAVCVNWDDAEAYVAWLSKKTGHTYRLLSEAEYEYVNRAGTRTAYWWGDAIGANRANCAGCGSAWDRRQTAPVGSFAPNAFGLYDTTGNVWSWTADCWNENYNGAPADGSANTGGNCGRRVLRGGSWYSYPGALRSSQRGRGSAGNRDAQSGFRVARTL